MRMLPRLVFGAACLLVPVASSSAQRCTGYPSLDVIPVAVSSTAVFANNESLASLALSGGQSHGWFGGASFGLQSFDQFYAELAPLVTGFAGREVPVGRHLSLCPMVGAVYEWGPNIGALKFRTTGVQAGLAVGWLFDPDDPSGLSAFAALSVSHLRTSVAGLQSTGTPADLKLGMVLPSSSGFRFAPLVTVPLSGRFKNVAIGIRVAAALRSRSPR